MASRFENSAEENYNELVKPRLTEIGFWVRDGRTMGSIAESLGIGVRTLQNYKNQFAELADILKKDKEYCDSMVINAVLKSALGYTVDLPKETYRYIYNPDGSLKECKLEKKEVNRIHVAANPTAQKMWLNARKREEWGGMVEAVEQEGGGIVLIPEKEIIDEPGEADQ